MTRFTRFDAADYLDSDESIAEYLTAALEDDDPDALLEALKTVARARGMTQLAKDAGLGRENLSHGTGYRLAFGLRDTNTVAIMLSRQIWSQYVAIRPMRDRRTQS